LRRLEAEGLVARAGTSGDGRPERRAFAITQAGQRGLDHWLAEPAALEVGRIEVLLKLFFSSRPARAGWPAADRGPARPAEWAARHEA
jgi:DNA-binding PadR family transcriptional regulator